MSRRAPLLRAGAATAVAALCLTAVPQAASAAPETRPPGLAKQDTLRWNTPKDFRIGSAVAGGGHHTRAADYPEPFPSDPYR